MAQTPRDRDKLGESTELPSVSAREALPAALGPIATRMIYEDERVRVWDQLIEPGGSTGPHRHDLPYALVTVEGSSLDVVPIPGYPAIHGDERLSVVMESRTAGVLPEGSVEEAFNTGDRPYRAILVEFKANA